MKPIFPGRRAALSSVAAAALLTAFGCSRPPERPVNVLLVTLDTVRADRLGCMGRADAGTPRLDELAGRGALFRDALAPSPLTLPSHCSILTGQDTCRHRVRHNSLFTVPDSVTTVAEIFSDAGLRTGAFVSSAVLAARHGLDQGFDRYVSPEVGSESGLFLLSERTAFATNADALGWIGSGRDRAFFAWVHYMEAHSPYEPPEPERSRFAADPYQGEIATLDRAFGELVAGLSGLGLLENTLIVVVADHGEDLGDHGEGTHGMFVYQSTLHVPFLVAGPGVKKGRVIDEPVSLIDVAPTILEALGLKPPEPCDGLSLWPALTRGTRLEPERSLYAETFVPRYDYGWSELRTLKSGHDKFIDAPRRELYELESDPGETIDLARRKAPRTRELATELGELSARAESAGSGPERVELSAAELEALAALGYSSASHASGSSSSSDGRSLADPKDKIRFVVELDRSRDLLRLGDFAGAERTLRGILEQNPEMLEARLSLLISLLLQVRLDEALVVGEELIERAEQLPNGHRIAAKAHVFLGKLHLEEGRPEEAVRQWELAFVVPQPPLLYELLAGTYRELGRIDEALRVLDEAEAKGEQSPALSALRAAIEGASLPG